MVAILILNWNGWRDTIECLKSLSRIEYTDYIIFLGDNGSTNDSKKQLSSYCSQLGYNADWLKIGEQYQIEKGKILLFDLQNNNGFAKGNNLLIKEASRCNPDYYLLLNNDTVVESDFLSKLIVFQYNNSIYKVLTPIIYYYDDKNIVWNAGGNLIWGIRKYHYCDDNRTDVKENSFIPCTFITGCALLCTPEVLMKDGKLFTEKFFHGEEDFDFGLRMKKKGIKMGCVTNSSIYHKVGRTSGNVGNKVGLTYCYYLNRFINLRHHLNSISFYLFIVVYLPYIFRLLLSQGFSIITAIVFCFKVIKESHQLNSVSFEKFMGCITKNEI